jgi:hypothetical protein
VRRGRRKRVARARAHGAGRCAVLIAETVERHHCSQQSTLRRAATVHTLVARRARPCATAKAAVSIHAFGASITIDARLGGLAKAVPGATLGSWRCTQSVVPALQRYLCALCNAVSTAVAHETVFGGVVAIRVAATRGRRFMWNAMSVAVAHQTLVVVVVCTPSAAATIVTLTAIDRRAINSGVEAVARRSAVAQNTLFVHSTNRVAAARVAGGRALVSAIVAHQALFVRVAQRFAATNRL